MSSHVIVTVDDVRSTGVQTLRTVPSKPDSVHASKGNWTEKWHTIDGVITVELGA